MKYLDHYHPNQQNVKISPNPHFLNYLKKLSTRLACSEKTTESSVQRELCTTFSKHWDNLEQRVYFFHFTSEVQLLRLFKVSGWYVSQTTVHMAIKVRNACQVLVNPKYHFSKGTVIMNKIQIWMENNHKQWAIRKRVVFYKINKLHNVFPVFVTSEYRYWENDIKIFLRRRFIYWLLNYWLWAKDYILLFCLLSWCYKVVKLHIDNTDLNSKCRNASLMLTGGKGWSPTVGLEYGT